MGFSGSLADLGLDDVFQNVAASRMTGTLSVTGSREICHVYFRRGQVSMAAWPGEAQRPLSLAGDRSLVSLVSGRDEESKEFIQELTESIRHRVYEVFAWSEGQFEFHSIPPSRSMFPEDQLLAELELDVNPILMEAARRTDEWSRVHQQIRDYRDVYGRVENPEEPLPDLPGAQAVYDMIDGQRDVTSIIEALADDRFTICRAMAALAEAGWVAPVPIDDRVDLAMSAARRGDHATAIRMMIAVLDAMPGAADLHTALATMYLNVGESASAARCHMNSACVYFDSDESEAAAASLRTAADLVPDDVPVHSEIYALLAERGLRTQARGHGVELAALLERAGKAERARTIYLELLQNNPSDPELLEGRAKCEAQLGQTRDAVRIYGGLAREAAKREDVERQKELLGRILEIDAGDNEALRMKSDIVATESARRRTVRTRGRAAVVWGLGIGLIGYLATHELMARSALSGLQEKNASLISQGRFSDAIGSYHDLRKAYPFSLARMECGFLIEELARGRLESIENRVRVPDAARTLDDLQLITGHAMPGDIFERTTIQISRLLAQQRIDELAATIDRPQALAELQAYRDPIGLPLIETLLEHSDARIRVAAMEPLVALQSYRSIPRLMRLLDDPAEPVRVSANKALQSLTDHHPNDASYSYWSTWWKTTGKARFKDVTVGAS